jgi:hypothetical protein
MCARTTRFRRSGRLVLAAAVAVTLGPAVAAAQAQLPVVQVRQVMGGGSFSFGSTGRAELDRDAFLVVFELGADNRARVLYPGSPRDRGFARADRPVYVPLPSADAAFIRTAELSIPQILAFASDVAPDLSAFTRDGRRWDYQYAISGRQALELTVAELAELLYGSADMPFSIGSRALTPQLPSMAQRQLASCGFVSNGWLAPDFNRFLWDVWGPVSMAETAWRLDQRYRDLQWFGLGQAAHFLPLSWSLFSRSTTPELWNRFGIGCDALQPYRGFVAVRPTPVPLPPGGTMPDDEAVPPPSDRELRPPGTVGDVGLVPASPQAMARREAAASRVATARQEPWQARRPLTRESTEALVRRTEIAATMAILTAERAAGQRSSVQDAFARARAGETVDGGSLVARQGNGRLTGQSGNARATRAGGGMEPMRTAGGLSSGSERRGAGAAGSASTGSASSSGGSEARGGAAASARGSTGRP